MKEADRKEIEDFDDILHYVGGWGPFQYTITLVNFLFTLFLGYVSLSHPHPLHPASLVRRAGPR